jgi:hypothetical protein
LIVFKHASVVAVLALAGLGAADVLACGDKFLVPGRGPRFMTAADRGSATVLLYAVPGSPLHAALAKLSVESTLRKAGYRPMPVSTEAAFAAALRTGTWDVAIVDLSDGPLVVSRLATAAAPILLPVAYDTSDEVMKNAKQRYPQVLRSPKKNQAFLDAIDKIILARARTRAKNPV